MVKISEIIRKEHKKEDTEILPPAPEVLEKVSEKTAGDTPGVYEEAILSIKQLMNRIKQGQVIAEREFVQTAETLVQELNTDKDTLLSLINDFTLSIKKENYLYEHSVNTALLATNIGLAQELSQKELVDLCTSSLLHDIGMLKIPEQIINKPSQLTKEEYERVKQHPRYGLVLLDLIKHPTQSSAEVIYQHHEKIDGSGYPEGKEGDEISEFAKIVGLVEVYEARTHPRPYHRVLPYDGVRMVVQAPKNTFDSRLVKDFLKQFSPYPPGSYVQLNNNEVGRIIGLSEDLPMRPVVEILVDSEGNFLEKPKKINLANFPVLSIKKATKEPHP